MLFQTIPHTTSPSMIMRFVALLLALASISCEAFLSYTRLGLLPKTNLAESKNSDGDDQTDQDVNPFALPAIGSSSFWDRQSDDADLNSDMKSNLSEISNGIKISDEVASRKFQLQYTCKLCNTRNSIKVTRIAYRKGIVIAKCKGCENKHLIADNLNWLSGFDYDNGERNIEQFMKNRYHESESGKQDLVVRVDKEVFDLEKVLYKGSEEDSALTFTEDEHWG